MKSKKTLLIICLIGISSFLVLNFLGLIVYYGGFSGFCDHYFKRYIELLLHHNFWTSFYVISCYYDLVTLYTFGTTLVVLSIVCLFKNKLLKLVRVLSIVFLSLNVLGIIFTFITIDQDITSLFDILPFSLLICFSLYLVILLFRIKGEELLKTSLKVKKRKSLHSFIYTIVSISSFFFVFATCFGIYIQNISKAKTGREELAIATDRALRRSFRPAILEEYIETGISNNIVSFYQSNLAATIDSNEHMKRIYVIVPEEDGAYYILDDGRFLTNESKSPRFSISTSSSFLFLPYDGLCPNKAKDYKDKALSCYNNPVDESIYEDYVIVYDAFGGLLDKRVNTIIAPMVDKTNKSIFALLCVEFFDISFFDGFDLNMINTAVSIVYIAILVSMVFVDYTDRKIINPLSSLNTSTGKLVSSLKNNEDIIVLDKVDNEIGLLAETFESVAKDTRAYIEQVSTLQSEKDKTKFELETAKQIQLGLLPKKMINNPSFDLGYFMEPMDDVGGDYYDYFMINDKTLAIIIADVSGTGVGAAIFMATGKAITKSTICRGTPLDVSLDIINKSLCDFNNLGLFITCFIGLLDIETGVLSYVNAGHNPPFLRKSETGFNQLHLTTSMILGRFENAVYKVDTIKLEDEDTLFCYTDGATDVVNDNNERLKPMGLLNILNSSPRITSSKLVPFIKDKLIEFEGNASRMDDITILSITYRNKPSNSIRVKASLDEFPKIEQYVESRSNHLKLPTKSQRHIKTIVDEMFRNISSYAYDHDFGEVEVCLKLVDEDIVLSFIDEGIYFNPLLKQAPNNKKDFKQFKNGGLGIFITKALAKDINYTRLDNQNILEIRLTKI